MNKLCKSYISDAKKFFPIMGKKERAYLRGIVSELEDCIERENITSKQELYTKYRQPYDLANDYYCRFETDEIVKKIRISKYIKILISVLVVTVLVATSAFIYFWSNGQQIAQREEMIGNKQIIKSETYEEELDILKSDNYIENDEIIEDDIFVEEIIE